jgi:hypothetical protein
MKTNKDKKQIKEITHLTNDEYTYLINYIENVRQEEKQRLIKEFKEMIEKHKDCKNYHRIDLPNKKEYILASCLTVILDKLNELEKEE